MSDLIGNPEDRFSSYMAHVKQLNERINNHHGSQTPKLSNEATKQMNYKYKAQQKDLSSISAFFQASGTLYTSDNCCKSITIYD